jgi:16S rRNA G527 N7-methylase RsmG
LVESRIKRAVFLEAVANKLGFSGAHVHAMRLDQYLKKCDRTWDCVSWKGLKLSDADLRELHAHSHAGTQLWMFHGKGLALKKPEMIEREFKLLRREQFPIHKGWILSIYAPI